MTGRVARLLNLPNAAGCAIGVALVLWDSAPLALVLAAVVAPVLALAATALWPNVTLSDSEDWFVDVNLDTAWFVPSAGLALQSTWDREMTDGAATWAAIWVVAAGAGVLATGLAVLIERRRPRGLGWGMGAMVLIGFTAWGFGAANTANVRLDPDPGVWTEGRVVQSRNDTIGNRSLRRAVGKLTVRLETTGDLRGFEVSRHRRDRWQSGTPVCVVQRTGAFGWRYEELRDCAAVPPGTAVQRFVLRRA